MTDSKSTVPSLYEEQKNTTSTVHTVDNNFINITITLMDEKITTLQTEVNEIKKLQKPEENYFKYATWIQKCALIILFLVPIIQIIVTVVMLNNVMPNDPLIGAFKWIAGSLGVITLLEIIYIPKQLSKLSNRVNSIEEKLK